MYNILYKPYYSQDTFPVTLGVKAERFRPAFTRVVKLIPGPISLRGISQVDRIDYPVMG
jgi:hypothetical protein